MYYHLMVQSKCITKSIRCKLESFLLLTFSSTGFQPNIPFSSLPGQADRIKFSGHSQTTLFVRQVVQASNQTCPRWLLLPFWASMSCWPRCRCLRKRAAITETWNWHLLRRVEWQGARDQGQPQCHGVGLHHGLSMFALNWWIRSKKCQVPSRFKMYTNCLKFVVEILVKSVKI